MASLSISAEDFTTAGSVPRAGLRVRMQVVGAFTVGDKTVSHVPWEMVTDDTGAASTVLPDAVAGVGVQVSIPVWAGFGFTIAGYPDEDLTVTGVGDYVVDPRTLQPSAASLTAWEATLAQVQDLLSDEHVAEVVDAYLEANPPAKGDPGPQGPPGAAGSPTAYELRGAGSPYGVLTPASAGIYYTDTLATCGAVRWVSTGTTVTSWKVVDGDTGWRYLDATNFPNHASSLGAIRCIGQTVTFIAQVGTVAYNVQLFAVPAGFGGNPSLNVGGSAYLPLHAEASSSTTNANGSASVPMSFRGSTIWFHGQSVSGTQYVHITWVRTDPWPTTLPGVAGI